MSKFESNDTPKYIKKKNSSTSKADAKSKHKHEYVDCLLVERENNYPYPASYCKICGKVGYSSCFEITENTDSGYRRLLSNEEIFEKYKELEQIKVDRHWQKYVPVCEVN